MLCFGLLLIGSGVSVLAQEVDLRSNSVQVVDAQTGKPIEEVRVNASHPANLYLKRNSFQALTDERGIFQLYPWWTDKDQFSFYAPGYNIAYLELGAIRKNGYKVELVPSASSGEFNKVAHRDYELSDRSAGEIQSVSEEDIAFYNRQNLPEAISMNGDLWFSRMETYGGILRAEGFGGNQIAWTVDGVKATNAFWGNRHDYAALLPRHFITKVEYSTGPASTLYGNNADGGVIGLETAKLLMVYPEPEAYWGADAGVGYNSALSGWNAEAKLKRFGNNFSFATSAAIESSQGYQMGSSGAFDPAGAYRTTAGPENDSIVIRPDGSTLPGAGFNRLEFQHKMGYYHEKSQIYQELSLQYVRFLPHTRQALLDENYSGNFTWSEAEYSLRDRLMAKYSFLIRRETDLFEKVKFDLAWQQWNENGAFRPISDTLKRYFDDNWNQLSGHLQFKKSFGKTHTLRYGARYSCEFTQSRTWAKNILNESPYLVAPVRPDGGGNQNEWGIYLTHFWKPVQRVKMVSGVDFTRQVLEARYRRGEELFWLPLSFQLPNNGVSGFMGVNWFPGNGYVLTSRLSTGYRMANLNDAAIVYQSSAGRPIANSPGLRPEYIVSGEIKLEKNIEGWLNLSATGFYRHLWNSFDLAERLWEGEDSATYLGQTGPILALDNIRQTDYVGMRIGGKANWGKWYARTRVSVTRAIRVSVEDGIPDNTAPANIPPVFGIIAAGYDYAQLRIELAARCFGSKAPQQFSRYPDDGYRTGLGTYPAGIIPEINFYWKPLKNLEFQGGIHNILDKRYRFYGSALHEPGRNISIGIKGEF